MTTTTKEEPWLTSQTTPGPTASGRTPAEPTAKSPTPEASETPRRNPGRTAYARGYAFEGKIAGALVQDGYWCIQARGSHGVADVVALKWGETLMVQAKTDGNISIADWNKLYALATRVGAVPLLAWRPKAGVIAYIHILGPAVARRPRPGRPWTSDEVIRVD